MNSITRIHILSSVLFLILSFLLSANSSFAETKIFIKEYTYQASEIDSKASCRVITLELVKRLLLEELGTYLESQTEVKNFQLTKDHITVLTAGIVRAEILDESWDGNTLKYRLKAKITVDPDSIIKSIDRIRNDKKKTKELEDVRKKADQAIEEIERLKKDLSSTRADMDKMKQYNNAVNKLSATDWFNMASEEYSKYEPNKELIISYYEKAISLNPEYVEAYWRLGSEYWDKSLFADGNTKRRYLDKSIAAYEKAIENNKDKEQERYYYSFLAHAYSDRGYIDKAIAAREKVIQILLKAREVIVPSPPAGYVIEPIITVKDDAELSSEYRRLGYEYKEKGDYRQAISAFNKAIQLSPDESNYSALAFAYKSSGNYVEAINAFKKVVELFPQYSRYSLGTMYKLNRNYEQAIKEFKSVIKLEPDNWRAYAELGSCYQLKGNKKQAKAAYQKADELAMASMKKEENFNKLSVDDLCNRVIREFGKEKKSIWISRYLDRAIELRPDYALPYYLKGIYWLSEYNSGRGAIMEFKRAIKLGLNNADVYYWLGEAYYLELLIDKRNLEKGAVKGKEKKEYIVALNNMLRDAINILTKAIQLHPDYKNSYLVLGDIYRINNQLEFAQDNYKKAKKILKPVLLESDKYMGRYYNWRKELDNVTNDWFKAFCDAGNGYACSWLSVTRE